MPVFVLDSLARTGETYEESNNVLVTVLASKMEGSFTILQEGNGIDQQCFGSEVKLVLRILYTPIISTLHHVWEHDSGNTALGVNGIAHSRLNSLTLNH